MSTPDKATVYIDIDDEITSIIDKVVSSKERIIALVLPKRAAVLQSIVNMKLLKRAADGQKKRLVLITSEAALLPLAGAAGLHVAKNLQSRPMVPITGVTSDAIEELNEGDSISFGNNASAIDNTPDETIDDFDPDAEADTSIGELAGVAAVGVAAGSAFKGADAADEMETIELDDAAEVPAALAIPAAARGKKAKKPPKDKKNKKLAVPNFNRFRLMLALGTVVLVVLVALIYVFAAVLPKATVTITTDTSDITTNATLTLDPKATTLDTTAGIVPAGFQQKQQSTSQQVPTTGQQNNGQQATGTVTMSVSGCPVSLPNDVPAGAGVSINGLTYITQSDTSFVYSGGKKCTVQATSPTDITAQKAGTTYNGANGTFTVAGRSDVTATSTTATSGGTDNIVKIVAQADIDSAQAKLAAQDSSATKTALTTALQQAGYQAINATFSAGTPSTSPSASVGTPSDTVTVTQVVTYSMYGVKNSDIKTFLTSRVAKQIDPSKQTITDDGVSSAVYKVTSTTPEQVAITATSVAGPDIKPATVQSEVGGMKAGEISSMLKQDPGVTNVTVKMSPFWVTSAPKKPSKIIVVFVKSQNSNTSNGSQP